MKTLQNNFTTIEQSKRLLVLGVPADSADCGIVKDIMHGGREILTVPYSKWCKGYENISFPCWSVGRLIEIELMCREKMDGLLPRLAFVHGSVSYIEELICYIEQKDHKYNFNKLED